jgi:PHP-associated
MYARGLDFNKAAIRWAARRGKPMVGNGDVHRLAQLGTTYSLVDAQRDPQSICDAIRAGRVEVRTEPLSLTQAVTIFTDILAVWSLKTSRARKRKRRDTSPRPAE